MARTVGATVRKKTRRVLEAASQTIPKALIKVANLAALETVTDPAIGQFRGALQRMGYHSVEEVLGVMQAAGREFKRAFGLRETDVQALASAMMSAASSSVSTAEMNVLMSNPCALGVALDQIPAAESAPGLTATGAGTIPPAAAPPASVNLIPEMPPIHNQQNRGTCVAFASLAAYEHLLIKNGTPVDLSEQFLYWLCKQNDGYPGEGTWIHVAFKGLFDDGCCLETTWPYNPVVNPINEGQGPAPPAAQLEALTYRIPNYASLPPTSVDDIKDVLAQGRCVAFAVPLYRSFTRNTMARKVGDIPNPLPGEFPDGGHAMCFVGYQDMPGVPGLGGGRFILRNSWGDAFGFASAFGPGYGTISYRYISMLCREAYAPLLS